MPNPRLNRPWILRLDNDLLAGRWHRARSSGFEAGYVRLALQSKGDLIPSVEDAPATLNLRGAKQARPESGRTFAALQGRPES